MRIRAALPARVDRYQQPGANQQAAKVAPRRRLDEQCRRAAQRQVKHVNPVESLRHVGHVGKKAEIGRLAENFSPIPGRNLGHGQLELPEAHKE